MRATALLLLCSPAAGFQLPLVASRRAPCLPATRALDAGSAGARPVAPRVGAIVMAEDNSNPLAKLPLPSIYAVAYAAIIYVTISDLTKNPLVLEWIANGTPLDQIPWLSFSGGTVLIVYAMTQLAQFAGVGKSDYYDDLEGPEVSRYNHDSVADPLPKLRLRHVCTLDLF